MRIINQTNSLLVLSNDLKTSIRLNPGEVSQQFLPTIKLVYQAILGRRPDEIAIISENSLDDSVLQKVRDSYKFVHNSVEEAMEKLRKLDEVGVQTIAGVQVKIEDLENTQKELNEALKKIEMLNEDIKTKNKSIQSLDSQLNEKIEEVKRLTSRIEGLESQSDKDADNTKSRIENLEESIKLKTTEFEVLKKEYNDQLEKIHELEKIIEELNNELNELRSNVEKPNEEEIVQLNQKIEELTHLLEAKDNEITEIKKVYNDLVDENRQSLELFNEAIEKFGLSYDPESGDWMIAPKVE